MLPKYAKSLRPVRDDELYRHFRNYILQISHPPSPGIFRVLGFSLTRNDCRNIRRSEQSENKFHTNVSVSCIESFLVSCTIGDEFDPEKSPRRLDERGLVSTTKFSQTGRFFIIAISYSNVVTSANEGE